MSAERTLSADEYDTLELAAIEHGGVARGQWFKNQNTDPNCPMCINGLGIYAGMDASGVAHDEVRTARPTSIDTGDNDDIVSRCVELRLYTVGHDGIERVPFADFCRVGNIHRGDA